MRDKLQMKIVLRIMALLSFPIASVLWLYFCVIPSPYVQRLVYPFDQRTDNTNLASFPKWECPQVQEEAGAQPITVSINNKTSDILEYHVIFEAWDKQYRRTKLCTEDIAIPSSSSREVTCQVDFSDPGIYSDNLAAVVISGTLEGRHPDLPTSQASYYWQACEIFTDEEKLQVTYYVVLAGITGLMLLVWGAVLLYKSHPFVAVVILLVSTMDLFVLNFIVLDPIPYHHVAWVLEFALIAGILWWSHRRQKSSTDSYMP
jgi:hypothetical protein